MTQPITINDLAMTTIVNGVVITSSNIPPQLQQVVNWVLMAINQQVKMNCGNCIQQPVSQNATSSTQGSAANATTVAPGPSNTTANTTASSAQTVTPGSATGTGTGTTSQP